jgi:hypothetical protein
MGMDEQDNQEALDKLKKARQKEAQKKKDNPDDAAIKANTEAILQDEKKKQIRDTAR